MVSSEVNIASITAFKACCTYGNASSGYHLVCQMNKSCRVSGTFPSRCRTLKRLYRLCESNIEKCSRCWR